MQIKSIGAEYGKAISRTACLVIRDVDVIFPFPVRAVKDRLEP